MSGKKCLSSARFVVRERFGEELQRSPSLLRGVPPRVLCEGVCYWVRKKNGPPLTDDVADSMYARSEPAQKLGAFLSHSWHAPAKVKALAILGWYNGGAAWVAACLACFGAQLLFALGCLPPWNDDLSQDGVFAAYLPPDTTDFEFAGWGTVTFALTYFTFVIWWQPLRACLRARQRADTLFFDRLCIHQADPELRAGGIRNIGGFLLHSDNLVILWDPSYFSRLWCVFELAVYLSLQPTGRITLVPIELYCAEVLLTLAMGVIMSLVLGGLSTEIPGAAVGHLASMWNLSDSNVVFIWHSAVGACFVTLAILPVRRFLRSRQAVMDQLLSFSASSARCFDEGDRSKVMHTIVAVFGDVASFDACVRRNLRQVITQSMGDSFDPPYSFALRSCTALTCSVGFDIFAALARCHRDDHNIGYLHYLAPTMIWWLLVIPALCQLMFQLAKRRLRTTSWQEELCVCIVNVLVVGLFVGVHGVSFTWCAAGSIFEHAMSLLIGLALALLVWRYESKEDLVEDVATATPSKTTDDRVFHMAHTTATRRTSDTGELPTILGSISNEAIGKGILS